MEMLNEKSDNKVSLHSNLFRRSASTINTFYPISVNHQGEFNSIHSSILWLFVIFP